MELFYIIQILKKNIIMYPVLLNYGHLIEILPLYQNKDKYLAE